MKMEEPTAPRHALCPYRQAAAIPTPPPAPEDMMSMWDGDTTGCMNGQFRCGTSLRRHRHHP
jgi:hypothetical protein